MGRVFGALRPALLVVSRSDLWPEMLLAAHHEGVPVAVVGGAVRPGSLRLATPARAFLRPLYQPIRFVGAVTEDDADRWRRLGVAAEALLVTGDPRHDQVLERPVRLDALREIAARTAGGPTLVAGSVENEDAGLLLEAYRQVRAHCPDARLVVVPHDPESEAVAPFRAVPEVIVVNSLGLLADLYLVADVAYVGGGFGRRGTHATAEPATFGIPTLVPSASLARQWLAWIEDPAAGRSAGLAARRALQSGAARISTDRLLALLSDHRLKD
jgi:3-deoxy-D-manno-octulosonic-acid transferase